MGDPEEPRAWERALREAEAGCARGDWAAVERAASELSDAIAAPDQEGRGPPADEYEVADAVDGAAALAVAGGRLDIAAQILRANARWHLQEIATVDALANGDPELCAAYLVADTIGAGAGKLALARALSERCATALLDGGSGDLALAAIQIINEGFVDPSSPEVSAGAHEEAYAWPDGRSLLRDRIRGAEALVRVCARRREGEHAEVFERCAAKLGASVSETPELLEEAARCASRCLDRGGKSSAYVMTYALHAILRGHEEEARARVDALIAAQRKPVWRRLMQGGWDRAQDLAVYLRGDGEPAGERALESEAGFTRAPLGEFTVVSSTLVVSDPCYRGVDTRVQRLLRNARPGLWTATALHAQVGPETLTAFLVASHADHPCSLCDDLWSEVSGLGVGVDSGQAGIFDLRHYRDEGVAPPDESAESAWYEMCLAAKARGGGVIPYGCVAVAGYGDGFYPCLIAKSERQIVGVAVAFGVVPAEPT